jgi:hypothetical protein
MEGCVAEQGCVENSGRMSSEFGGGLYKKEECSGEVVLIHMGQRAACHG